jgi:hypothetical protein
MPGDALLPRSSFNAMRAITIEVTPEAVEPCPSRACRSRRYADRMEGAVAIQTVESEEEAELVCGLLRAAGIACGYRPTDAVDSPFQGLSSEGPQEIFVAPRDEAAGRLVISDARR